ncbi:MAG TPA: ATP-dependent Clp protease ATP-binding subunit [Bacillota bacterium]|nr:ATP-dependent Clp protease ATP-binding subunit [Bacillota bacterium]
MSDLTTATYLAVIIGANEAHDWKSECIETEHILVGLLKVEDFLDSPESPTSEISEPQWNAALAEITSFRALLDDCDINCQNIRRRLRKLIIDHQGKPKKFSGHRSARCKEMFVLADEIHAAEGNEKITLTNMMTAVLKAESDIIAQLFQEFFLAQELLLLRLAKHTGNDSEGFEAKPNPIQPGPKVNHPSAQTSPTPFLDQYGRDLTALARAGQINPVIGRNAEMKQMVRILIQKERNNILLAGDAGVGKTSLVEGLAQKLLQPGLPDPVKNFRIIEITVANLVAGAKFRGAFEEKMACLLKEASSNPNIVLFIDEFHTIMGAGSTAGALDASNIIKPALARGEIKCIGATTTEEYRKYIEKDPAFNRRFQLVWVDEPTREETLRILQELKPEYEAHYCLRIEDGALEKAVDLSLRYLPHLKLPGKAKDLVEKACAAKSFKTFTPSDKIAVDEHDVTKQDIYAAVAEICNIPAGDLSEDDTHRLLHLEKSLGERVIGQGEAVTQVAETIRMAMADFKEPQKPLGVFLFLGPTGVGKTELAKALAEFLFHDSKRLLTIDMSEYQEKHAIAKLIGAPPGYIGYDQEGYLTTRLRQNPFSVVLFDEVEKAHPEIFDIFLQIFDEGRMTDGQGRRVIFSEAVIILTSNLGSEYYYQFTSPPKEDPNQTIPPEIAAVENLRRWRQIEVQIRDLLQRKIKPEILNRIQKTIFFHPLNRETLKKIVRLQADEFQTLLANQKGITLAIDDSALELIVTQGDFERYGARELKRSFEALIKEPLSTRILNRDYQSGAGIIAKGINAKIEWFPFSS